MHTNRPFRFGVQSFTAGSAEAWRAKARMAEELGYSSFLLADHYIGPGPALTATNHPIQELAAIPAIAVAAEATKTIHVGCRVLCVDYHQPVVLAKEAATLDFLSGGRLELGLGAGWLQGEYDAMGIQFDPPARRIRRLAEVIALVKAHMGTGPVAIDGEEVRASGFEGLPKPIQQPHPPIMVGGGSKRVLQLAAREADIVSLNFNNRAGVIGPDGVGSSSPEKTHKKIAWIRDAAGDRAADLELEIGAYFTFVTDQSRATAGAIGRNFGMTADEMIHYPHALIGSVDEICEELLQRRCDYGISYYTVGDGVAEQFAPVVGRLSGK
jgi:probable F420-dependent oxidoreductase